MIARTLHVRVSPHRIDSILEAYREDVRPIHDRAQGLLQHYVLVDRESGDIEIVGIWDSAEAVVRIAPQLEPARARLWERFGQDPPVAVYEVGDILR